MLYYTNTQLIVTHIVLLLNCVLFLKFSSISYDSTLLFLKIFLLLLLDLLPLFLKSSEIKVK